jgi:membrane glycosyltransferase
MQYLKLLDLPGLKPISRFQLLWAILMFVGIPAWTLMIALLPVATLDALAQPDFPVTSAKLLYGVFLLMYLSPKIAGLIDAATTPGEMQRFGGALRFSVSAAIEIVFSFLQGAVTTIRTSLFMLGLPFGRSIIWSGQKRDADGVSWREAFAALWPQLVFGLMVCGALYAISPTVLLWSLPLTAGYLLAIPFAVVTAHPPLGCFMRRHGVSVFRKILRRRQRSQQSKKRTVAEMTSEALKGVFRSLRVYHGASAPRAAMDALYGRFIKPGDLVFDVGAHVGDRISSFRRLGARVVALEPQPLLQRALHLIHGRDPAVILLPAAVAAEPGTSTLHIKRATPPYRRYRARS